MAEDGAKDFQCAIMAHRHDLSPSQAFRIIVAAAVLVTCAREAAVPHIGMAALLAIAPAEFWPEGESRPAEADERAASVCKLLQLPRRDLAKVRDMHSFL
jgi:hypothetical protein